MSRQGFQYLAIVASSYKCVYRAVLPVWRPEILENDWRVKVEVLGECFKYSVCCSHFQ